MKNDTPKISKSERGIDGTMPAQLKQRIFDEDLRSHERRFQLLKLKLLLSFGLFGVGSIDIGGGEVNSYLFLILPLVPILIDFANMAESYNLKRNMKFLKEKGKGEFRSYVEFINKHRNPIYFGAYLALTVSIYVGAILIFNLSSSKRWCNIFYLGIFVFAVPLYLHFYKRVTGLSEEQEQVKARTRGADVGEDQEPKGKCPARKGMVTTSLQCMAGIGILLIVYGVVLLGKEPLESEEWRVLLYRMRPFVDWISTLLTLVGVFLVGLSAYFMPHSREPDEHSMKYVAPVVMLLAVAGVTAMIYFGVPLNRPIILGFAVLSLSGATLKALPFSEQQPDTYDVPLFRAWPWW